MCQRRNELPTTTNSRNRSNTAFLISLGDSDLILIVMAIGGGGVVVEVICSGVHSGSWGYSW